MSTSQRGPAGPVPLTCPACGASLDLDDLQGRDLAECGYCGSAVSLPAARTDAAVPASGRISILVDTTEAPSRSGVRRGRLLPYLATVVVVVSAFTINAVASGRSSLRSLLPGGGDGFARKVQEFGGKGTGPGLLDDPRYVAIEKDGSIWTADYQDGRVQKFDPRGGFVRVIQVPPTREGYTYLDGLAVDGHGRLYVSRGGQILVFGTGTGRQVATIKPTSSELRYESIAVDPNGVLFALSTSASSNTLVRLGADGRPAHRWERIVSKVNAKDPALSLSLAVDGLGEIFISSSFGSQVYRYGADGAFVDRFGEAGDQPGQLSDPGQVAVDGQSRVYVHSFGGIEVFDRGGRYLGRIAPDYTRGAPMGVALDRFRAVYLVTNGGKVLKYELTAKG